MVWIFSITLTKEVDFNQASPSYEVAMGISQGKEKSHGAHIWLLSTSSHGKNRLTNLRLKYPASRKVLFGTERLSGKTWVRRVMVSGFASGMMFGRAILLRDACHNISIHKVLMTSK